ncbi:MAG TPA: hypothetical protein ENF44_00175 [Deltaproteobacteria bacterium]|nr:hypothetical protein [Deltaproteobacteria bacterium]
MTERGFTVMEVVVAVLVMALLVGGLMGLLGGNLRLLRRGSERVMAEHVIQQVLNMHIRDEEPASASGQWDGFDWVLTVDDVTPADGPMKLYELCVECMGRKGCVRVARPAH